MIEPTYARMVTPPTSLHHDPCMVERPDRWQLYHPKAATTLEWLDGHVHSSWIATSATGVPVARDSSNHYPWVCEWGHDRTCGTLQPPLPMSGRTCGFGQWPSQPQGSQSRRQCMQWHDANNAAVIMYIYKQKQVCYMKPAWYVRCVNKQQPKHVNMVSGVYISNT